MRNRSLVVSCFLGAAFHGVLLYPGFLTCCDETWQLTQALGHYYNDWHPPMMAYLWHWLIFFDFLNLPNEALIFFLNLCFFWGGLALLLKNWVESLSVRLMVVGIFMFHPVSWAVLSQISKDALLTTTLIAIAGTLSEARASKTYHFLWLGVALAMQFLAVALRHNGFPLLVPFSIWTVALVRKDPSRNGNWGRPVVALGIALCGVLWGATKLFEKTVIRPESARVEQVLFGFDLVGISATTSPKYLPASFFGNHGFESPEALIKAYSPLTAATVFFQMGAKSCLPRFESEAEVLQLRRQWWSAVRSEPRAYLKHRLTNFSATLGLIPVGRLTYGPYVINLEEANRGRFLPKFAVLVLEQFRNSPWLKAWPYLVGLLILAFAGHYFSIPLLPALAVGSALYELTYLPLGISNEFYYSYPMVACFAICGIRVIASFGRANQFSFFVIARSEATKQSRGTGSS